MVVNHNIRTAAAPCYLYRVAVAVLHVLLPDALGIQSAVVAVVKAPVVGVLPQLLAAHTGHRHTNGQQHRGCRVSVCRLDRLFRTAYTHPLHRLDKAPDNEQQQHDMTNRVARYKGRLHLIPPEQRQRQHRHHQGQIGQHVVTAQLTLLLHKQEQRNQKQTPYIIILGLKHQHRQNDCCDAFPLLIHKKAAHQQHRCQHNAQQCVAAIAQLRAQQLVHRMSSLCQNVGETVADPRFTSAAAKIKQYTEPQCEAKQSFIEEEQREAQADNTVQHRAHRGQIVFIAQQQHAQKRRVQLETGGNRQCQTGQLPQKWFF